MTAVTTLSDKEQKRPPGRPRRQPAPKNPRKVRQWVLTNTRLLENLGRIADGKRVRAVGPTGKLVWRIPDWEDQKWAMGKLLPKVAADLTSAGLEVSGPDGGPVRNEHTRTPIRDDRELGRRLALALALGRGAGPIELEARVIDATPAAPPVNGTEARLLPGDTIDGLRITTGANGAHKPTLPSEESPAEYELLAPPRSDQLPSPPLLPEARRGHEAKRRRP